MTGHLRPLLAGLLVLGASTLATDRAGASNPVRATAPVAGAVGGTGGASARTAPLAIAGTSLAQNGQNLVWGVRLAKPFALASLSRTHRTLCLLIERASDGAVTRQACVSPTGRRGLLRLSVARVTASGPGRASPVTAAITSSSAGVLTVSFLPAGAGIGYQALRWQTRSAVSPPACVPASSGATTCASLAPARPSRLALHTPRLVGCTAAGPSEVFHGSYRVREVALTFDDGPWYQPSAGAFVNLLAREHVPATFFEIGRQIPQYDPTGGIERAMLAHGDMIGDHTWSHPEMPRLSAAAQRTQLTTTAAVIRQRTGFTPCLWRPPFGDVNARVVSLARALGMLTVMWDVDPNDWAQPGTGTIVSRVVNTAHNGAIVIQHFGGGPRYETYNALPQEISTLRRAGYRFVTVAQLLGLRLIYR